MADAGIVGAKKRGVGVISGELVKNDAKVGVIDTHCHIHDREFFSAEQQEEFLRKARRDGVEAMVTIGTDVEDSLSAKKFAEKHENVFWTFGIHPDMAKNEKEVRGMVEEAGGELAECFLKSEQNSEKINVLNAEENEKLDVENGAKKLKSRPVAVGEIGLDYREGEGKRSEQIALLEGMLDLAVRYDLPVSFHVRKAFHDFFPVVANFPKVRGIVHCFTDSKKNLRRILEQTDFLVAVNGLATYSTLPTPPLARTVLETDAPFLAPREHRGQINQPAYVVEVAEWLATQLAVAEEEVRERTTENARRFYGI